MGVSKVVLDGVTQIDLTQDTVTKHNLYANSSAINAAGDKIMGKAQADNEDALLEKTISGTYVNSDITAVRSCAFQRQYGLTKVELPNATTIKVYGFYACTSLEEVDIPKVTVLETSVFSECTKLKTISMPLVTTIPSYGFSNTGMESIYFPTVTTVNTSAFYNCSSLQSVSLTSATEVATWAFYKCSNLSSFVAPKVANLRDKCFHSCKKLVNLDIPYTIHCGDNVFNGCSSLSYFVHDIDALYTANFQNCTSLLAVDCGPRLNIMRPSIFQNDSKFNIFVIRKNSVVSLDSINAFAGTPFASGGTGGILYVPAAVVSSYETKTNWSTILAYENNQIKSIESTHEDSDAPIDLTLYYVDGTPIT